MKDFMNVYNDSKRASSYAKLKFPGTYHLAFRDLPMIIKEHIIGLEALDFGCGAGRSTRFIRNLGFQTIGVDISQTMIDEAYKTDPTGHYHLINDGELNGVSSKRFDLVFSAFTFDNIPGYEKKVILYKEFFRVLKPTGIVINLVSSPELYVNEWASFSTKDFTTNKTAKCGDKVYTIMNDVEDKRPVEDVFWPDDDYKKVYRLSGFDVANIYKPLASPDDPYIPVNENHTAPWTIYVLNKQN